MYIPKNRMTTNLYTRGEEYKNVATGIPYIGYYWKMYNGTTFTGKNPNAKPLEELIIIENQESIERLESENQTFQQYVNNYDAEVVPGQYQNMNDIDVYNNINKVNISSTKLVPQQYYPSPTDEEYTLGFFTRYFSVKLNELLFLEINKTTYTEMLKRNPQYLFELYQLFTIEWTLIGGQSEAYNINFNQVEIVENKLNKKGLKEFLKNDFLRFYAPNSGEILYSNGEGLTLPNGEAYIGEYHVMLDGTPMTGRTHNRGNNIPLTQIYD